MVKNLKSPRRLLALGVFAIVAMSAFGFAAANTFPNGAGVAGDGQGAISGGAVTNVVYDASGTNLLGVEFDYSAFVGNVRVAVKDAAVNGNDLAVANTAQCTITHPTPATTHFDCTFVLPAAVAAANGLRVTTW